MFVGKGNITFLYICVLFFSFFLYASDATKDSIKNVESNKQDAKEQIIESKQEDSKDSKQDIESSNKDSKVQEKDSNKTDSKDSKEQNTQENKKENKQDNTKENSKENKQDNNKEKESKNNKEKEKQKAEKKAQKQLQKDIKKAKKQKPLSILPDNNPYLIDYENLDKKYYPFIQRSGKFYDSDIKETIRKVDIAERKSGVFLGFLWGANLNVDTQGVLANLDSITSLNNPYMTQINYLLFGLKIGYQSYIGQVLPLNTLGYQIFVDIASSFKENAVFYTTLNIGLLYDFFETKRGGFGATFYLNLGFGSANITGFESNNIYEFAGRLDLGFGVRFGGKNKINFSLINIVGGLQSYYLSFTPSVGYEYVF